MFRRALPDLGFCRLVILFLSALMLAPAVAQAGVETVPTTWRLLDYIAVDYKEAVADGRIVNQFEYDEMGEFSKNVASSIAALPASPAQAALERDAAALREAIAAKAPPEQVAGLARSLAAALLAEHPVPLAPTKVPDMSRAAALFAQNCGACHGDAGQSPPAALMNIDPPPIDFTDRDRARERSAFGLYQVITQGLEGTTMPSFAALSEEQRWALAFYAGGIAFADEERGERIWNGDERVRRLIPDMAALAAVTPAALAREVGPEKAYPVIAYLRANPGAAAGDASQGGRLDVARDKLRQSLAAYEAGDRSSAEQLALSAYLDGFEPVEAVLATRDGDLMTRVERAMSEFRAAISSGAPESEVAERLAAVEALLGEAEAALAPEAATELSTFLGAFTILLREGLEALLIVIAMIAFLKKAERPEVLPYVHGGWVAALLAGGATWLVATYLVGISGASRELTEGFGAILAAVILVSVGIWMHGKAQAEEWRRYIQAKMGKALSRGSAWFLFGLAFIVVYREVFETILFFAALSTPDNGGTLLAGSLAAVALLALIAWAMLRYSRKLPITQFFAYSAILIALLAVVLAGKGVGALQEAGLVAMTLLPGVPRIDLLGIVPTAEAIGAQLVTLAVLILGFRVTGRPRPAVPAPAE
jgi:high-affinity iron transporter